MQTEDLALGKRLLEGDESAFEQVYKTYFGALHAYAFSFLRSDVLAEEAVQNVFFRIWRRKDALRSLAPLKPYLYRSVHNESLNMLKRLRREAEYAGNQAHSDEGSDADASELMQAGELKQRIAVALNALPPQCGTVFRMSRFEELRYQDIADKLGISVKTVENHIGKALKMLRVALAEYLPLIPFLISLMADRFRGGGL